MTKSQDKNLKSILDEIKTEKKKSTLKGFRLS